jgi:hypothetical protein
VCAYAPYPVKVWCNGHEIARRAALAEGIAVTPLANGLAATSDPARLQLTIADREHDCWWQLSMQQIESLPHPGL